jgi:hypothetical protein
LAGRSGQSPKIPLELAECTPFSTGVVHQVYRKA